MGMQLAPRLLLLPILATASVSNLGCGLLSADFEGQVKIEVSLDDEDKEFFSIEKVNPEDNEDYRNNKDKISDGRIDSIDLEFTSVIPCIEGQNAGCNRSTLVVGQVDVRRAGTEDWVAGVGAWEGIQVIEGNKFRLNLAVEQQEAINKLVFEEGGELDVRLAGIADQGPVKFNVQVVLNMTFTASL